MKSFLKKKWVCLSEGCKIWVRGRKGKCFNGEAAGNSVVFLFIGNAKNRWLNNVIAYLVRLSLACIRDQSLFL